MKKLISLAAAFAVAISCTGAQAAGRVENLINALEDDSQIHIIYNDKLVDCDGALPINRDGRVMIPFRAALESMGATVDYSEESGLVTASKDDVSIKFTLMDDTIYTDKNGEQSEITMDVPMIVENDRTFVPVRFMSEALGMEVGWDGYMQTVVIIDYDDYAKSYETVMPNLSKTAELSAEQYNTERDEFSVGFDMYGLQPFLSKINFALEGGTDIANDGNAVSTDINVNNFKFNEYELKDVTFSILVKDSQLYVKTNAAQKAAEIIPDESVKTALSFVNGDAWYKVDLDKLLDAAPIPEESKDMLKNIMQMISSGNTGDVSALITQIVSGQDVSVETAVMLASMLDTYEIMDMDKYITVEEKENGGWSVSMNMTEEDFASLMNEIVGEEYGDVTNGLMKMSMSAQSEYDGEKLKSSAAVNMNIGEDDPEYGEPYHMGMSIMISSEAENKENVPQIQMPSDAVDLTELIVNEMNK